jgi:hypothetical protein
MSLPIVLRPPALSASKSSPSALIIPINNIFFIPPH